MRTHPRYGPDPVLVLDSPDPASVLTPLLRQRRRLEEALGGFDADAWSTQSRCDAWTNRDVVVHLAVTNRFWATSITHGRQGAPTTMLAEFDPVADPPRHVQAVGSLSDAEVHALLRGSTDLLEQSLSEMDADDWALPAESPLGHVPVGVAAHHALWDGWVHERDIAEDVDLVPPVVADEVEHALRFACGFGPALHQLDGSDVEDARGTVESEDPRLAFSVVRAGGQVRVTARPSPDAVTVLRCAGVDLLEGLSLRTPLDVPADARWLTTGLQHTFEAGRPR